MTQTNYKRKALITHYKNKIQNVKESIKNELRHMGLIEKPEVELVDQKRMLPARV